MTPTPPAVRSPFIDALTAATVPLIMEIKLVGAHGGALSAGRSVAECLAAYEAAGAPVVSVVTGRWFGGSSVLVREVVARTDLPVLRKDFFTRPDQIRAAADQGVAAVLLTAGLLSRSGLARLVGCCFDQGVTPFVEVTGEDQIRSVPDASRCVIAVNNKDINSGERDQGDIGRSTALLASVVASGTPAPVSASGIDSVATAARLLGAGYTALLVGTALMRPGAPREWAAELTAARSAA